MQIKRDEQESFPFFTFMRLRVSCCGAAQPREESGSSALCHWKAEESVLVLSENYLNAKGGPCLSQSPPDSFMPES
jgi:hypothetical protein